MSRHKIAVAVNDLQSISSTFYASVFRIFQKKKNVTSEKLCKALLYKKRMRKMWMKLTPVETKQYLINWNTLCTYLRIFHFDLICFIKRKERKSIRPRSVYKNSIKAVAVGLTTKFVNMSHVYKCQIQQIWFSLGTYLKAGVSNTRPAEGVYAAPLSSQKCEVWWFLLKSFYAILAKSVVN